MADRFMVASVVFCGHDLAPSDVIPGDSEGKRYSLVLRDNVLTINGEGTAIFFAAGAVPLAATAIDMSAVAMTQITFPDATERYVVIRRSENLSTFPGKLSFPGGFMDKWGDQFYGTAMRELEEETGEWCKWMSWSGVHEVAIIDSVPRPDRHNITVVVSASTIAICTPDELAANFVPQPGEVSAVYLMTLEEMKTRCEEFTPGLAKLIRAK